MNWDIENHLKEFPHAGMFEHEGRLVGQWIEGSYYKRKNGYYGEYPPSYIRRVKSLFPEAKNVLHVFSGSVQEDTTFDCNPALHPAITGNAENIDLHFGRNSVDLVLCDPPYEPAHAKVYGTKMPMAWKVLRSLHKIVEPDGVCVWLCTRIPIYSSKLWSLDGLIGYYCGTNRLYRAVIIFRKKS